MSDHQEEQKLGKVYDGQLMRRLSEPESRNEADLLSYLLFDGTFCGQLIELGRADARARHEELCAFFADKAPLSA